VELYGGSAEEGTRSRYVARLTSFQEYAKRRCRLGRWFGIGRRSWLLAFLGFVRREVYVGAVVWALVFLTRRRMRFGDFDKNGLEVGI
jgi:hypothetical protein